MCTAVLNSSPPPAYTEVCIKTLFLVNDFASDFDSSWSSFLQCCQEPWLCPTCGFWEHRWRHSVSCCLWPWQQPTSVLSTCESVGCFCLRHIRRVKLHWLKLLTELWRPKEDRFADSFLLCLPSPSWPLHDSFWRNPEKREPVSTSSSPNTGEGNLYTTECQDHLWDLLKTCLLSVDSQAAITEPLNQIWGRPLFQTELWLQATKD